MTAGETGSCPSLCSFNDRFSEDRQWSAPIVANTPASLDATRVLEHLAERGRAATSGLSGERWQSISDGFNSAGSFDAGTVDMELSVKERGEASQRTVLEAWISGQTRVVATSSEPDLTQALNEVRGDLIRQLTDAKNRTEPRNNPTLRVTDLPES